MANFCPITMFRKQVLTLEVAVSTAVSQLGREGSAWEKNLGLG